MLKKTEHKEIKLKVPLFRPLVHPEFRHLCVANFLANIGSWMQIFATGWLVAIQTKDPSVSAMAQTLTQIPIFLFSVLGGVMADRYQSFRYLGSVNVSMMISSIILASFCLLSVPAISIIFIFTFLTASGTALKASAWQATMSSLVAPEEIEAAATLNGLSYNLASIIGPSLGAMLFAITGAAALYFTNAICLASLAVIYFWMQKGASKSQRNIKKSFLSLLTEGLRISAGSIKFRGILIITALIFFSVSTFQAMLPAYVSLIVKGNSHTLGLLMGGFGAGAVIAAFSLSTLRTLLFRHQLLALACGVYGMFLFIFSTGAPVIVLVPVAIVGGFAWASIVSTMNSSAQSVFDSSLRARALSVYSMCFYGSLTLGSLTWGKVSALYGIQTAFCISSRLMACTALYVFFASNTRD